MVFKNRHFTVYTQFSFYIFFVVVITQSYIAYISIKVSWINFSSHRIFVILFYIIPTATCWAKPHINTYIHKCEQVKSWAEVMSAMVVVEVPHLSLRFLFLSWCPPMTGRTNAIKITMYIFIYIYMYTYFYIRICVYMKSDYMTEKLYPKRFPVNVINQYYAYAAWHPACLSLIPRWPKRRQKSTGNCHFGNANFANRIKFSQLANVNIFIKRHGAYLTASSSRIEVRKIDYMRVCAYINNCVP